VPFADSQGCRIYYRLEGAPGRPLLVLAHALGADHGMWAPQMPSLLDRFEVLRPDLRGHGASDAPAGDYTIAELARDVLAVVDATGRTRFSYCGLSLGGMVGQWLGAHAGGRVERLVLANTTPCADAAVFEARRTAVRDGGMAAVAPAVMERFFSSRTLASGAPHVASMQAVMLATDPVGYAGCCAAVRDMDHRPLLGRITVPTTVIDGDRDVATPFPGHGDVLASGIPGARVVRLTAGHLSSVEQPASFTAALFDALLPAGPGDTLEAGTVVRRGVLGDTHVDRAMASSTDFTREFQELITRFAWGAVWARPGLDRRIRRLLVLAMTAALGRWEEFRLHVRTGLADDLEVVDLKEVLLQVAVYAGVAAANTAFHVAADEQTRRDAKDA
jgi:3-oxoadipate enol-lactonase/4-carboxymuconolactone decarboxylase